MSSLVLALSPILRFMRREWLLVAVVCFAFLYSLYQFTEVPPTWYDEGLIVQLAMNLERYGSMATQTAPGVFVSGAYTSTGFPVVAPIAMSFALFGTSLASARAVMVIFVVLLILAAYLFVKRFAGQKVALWSAVLLVSFSSLYGNGKNVLGEVPGLFFLCLFLIFAHAIFAGGVVTRKNAILVGLFFGLCIVTKPTFLVLGGAVFVALIYVYVTRGRQTFPVALIPWGIGAMLVPLCIWAGTQFSIHDDFSKILAFYVNPYQLTDIASVMVHNFSRLLTETTPLYLLGMVFVWAVSIGMRVWKKAQLSFVEVTSMTFVMLVILAYSRTPGWYRYLFPAQIISVLFFPASLFYIAQNFPITRLRKLLSYSFPVLLVSLVLLQLYILFFSSWLSGYADSKRNALLRDYFADWNGATSVLIYDNPQLPLFLPRETLYYQYIEVTPDGRWEIGAENRTTLKEKVPDAIVVSSDTALFAGYAEKDTVANVRVLVRDVKR